MAKISKRVVDALEKPERQRWLWDTELKGFGICMRPSGVHSYVFNYRDKFGRQRNITIGKIGAVTPDIARKKAEEHRRTVFDGHDPIVEKAKAREALTVGELFDRYLESDAFKKKAPSTQTVDRGRIAGHLRPLLGKLALPAVTPSDIERAHKKIVAGDTAQDTPSGKKRGRTRVRGGEGTARMAIRLLRAILSWARKSRIVTLDLPADVAANVDIGRDGKRDLILDDPAAYARLWATLDRLTDPTRVQEGERLLRSEAADAIRVIALTGARKGEIAALRWQHVNLPAGTLTLPIDAHKTGRKTGAVRVIGLPALAGEIIGRQARGEADDLVFRPARDGAMMDLTVPWRAVRTLAKLPDGIGLHGLRHSLASHMAMAGAEASEIMTALGHRDITTSARYVHWARDKRQALAEKAAAGITAAVTGAAAAGKSETPSGEPQ